MDSSLYVNMFSHHNPNHPLSLATHSPNYDSKPTTPGPVYLRQHRTIELIELIEVPAPPPRQQPSTITSSEASSSSYTDSCNSSNFDSEEESAGSSYCSSDEEEMAQRDMPFYDDTYRTRLGRILAWRDTFTKAADHSPATSNPTSHASLSIQKRKVEQEMDDEETSLPPKRSRSIPPPEQRSPWSHRRYSAHSCSACDASFTSRQSLRQHGRGLGPSDPCRVAVEYGFES